MLAEQIKKFASVIRLFPNPFEWDLGMRLVDYCSIGSSIQALSLSMRVLVLMLARTCNWDEL